MAYPPASVTTQLSVSSSQMLSPSTPSAGRGGSNEVIYASSDTDSPLVPAAPPAPASPPLPPVPAVSLHPMRPNARAQMNPNKYRMIDLPLRHRVQLSRLMWLHQACQREDGFFKGFRYDDAHVFRLVGRRRKVCVQTRLCERGHAHAAREHGFSPSPGRPSAPGATDEGSS